VSARALWSSVGRWSSLAAVAALAGGATAGAAEAASNPRLVSCPHVALAPTLATDRNPDGTSVRTRPDARGKYVPIVMVHGWTGRATHDPSRTGAFSSLIDLTTNPVAKLKVPRSLIGQLQRVPGAAVYTFDYHDYSARWVDDSHLGPALGEAIDCLYGATRERVIVVGHSMGGLVARSAVTHSAGRPPDRARKVSTVVTFGTPEAGSLIADLVASGLDAGPAGATRAPGAEPLAVLRLMLATCGSATSRRLETGTLCDFLPEFAKAFDSAAGRALRAGSGELAALRPFPKDVTLDALAGDITLEVPDLGWFVLSPRTREVSMGDLAVASSSATSGATLSKKARCAYQLNVVRGATDSLGLAFRQVAEVDVAQPIWNVKGPCMHGNLMRSIELTNEATGAISDDIEGRGPAMTPLTLITAEGDSSYRVGPYHVERVLHFDPGSPTSLADVEAKLGPDNRCNGQGPDVTVTWPARGITGQFTTFGVIADRNGQPVTPPATGCQYRDQVQVDRLTATAADWHTRQGLKIGDPLARLGQLYPTATEHADGWWLHTIQLPWGDPSEQGDLLATVRNDQVTALTVVLTAQGD
jgi:pimeloyl-ACP methyl ester carboxylesterase